MMEDAFPSAHVVVLGQLYVFQNEAIPQLLQPAPESPLHYFLRTTLPNKRILHEV